MVVVAPKVSLLTRYAYRHLMSSGVPSRLIEEGLLGADEGFNDPFASGWVFRSDRDGIPFRDPENTGRCAVTLSSYDAWASPDMRHSTNFPRLRLSIFSDPSRDLTGNPVGHDAEERCLRVWEAIHPLFHDTTNQIHRFGDLPIISTVAGGGFSLGSVGQGDGLVRGDIGYNVIL